MAIIVIRNGKTLYCDIRENIAINNIRENIAINNIRENIAIIDIIKISHRPNVHTGVLNTLGYT